MTRPHFFRKTAASAFPPGAMLTAMGMVLSHALRAAALVQRVRERRAQRQPFRR